jgi:hypothetical protein
MITRSPSDYLPPSSYPTLHPLALYRTTSPALVISAPYLFCPLFLAAFHHHDVALHQLSTLSLLLALHRDPKVQFLNFLYL